MSENVEVKQKQRKRSHWDVIIRCPLGRYNWKKERKQSHWDVIIREDGGRGLITLAAPRSSGFTADPFFVWWWYGVMERVVKGDVWRACIKL